MFKPTAICALAALGFGLASLVALPFVGSGCGSDDCACPAKPDSFAWVTRQCWCGTNDCLENVTQAEQRLCKSVAKGASVSRRVGCGIIQVGTWEGRTPMGEGFYFDEATGKHVGGYVLFAPSRFGPCETSNYGYGVKVECPLTTNTLVCQGN